MSVMPHDSLHLTPGAEHGFTLVELLVAMVLSLIVGSALLAILEFSANQEARISDRVQADRIGRVAMANVVDELHSSCTGFGAIAIQGPSSAVTAPLKESGALDLWFLSTYGTATSGNAAPSSVIEHDIHWTSTGTSNTGLSLGTLTDYRFASSGGSSPSWKFPQFKIANATSTRTLATNVITNAGVVFQYYKFSTPSSSALVEVAPAQVPAAAAANEIAQVTIGFVQAPTGGDTRKDRTSSFGDSVVLRFNPAETGAEAANVPCA
jgi:prepilin-type N-terminal cleavage/methylation domain-containing protein